jgi:hypothetical protein
MLYQAEEENALELAFKVFHDIVILFSFRAVSLRR